MLTNIYRKIGVTFALVIRTLWHLSNIISPYPTWHLKPDPNTDGCSQSILLLSEVTVIAEASYWIWRCRGQRSAGWWALCPASPPRSSRRCSPRHTALRAWCPSAIHWSSSAARWNIPEHRHINYTFATMLEAPEISWVLFELNIWQVYCLDKLWLSCTNVICIWTKSICAQLRQTQNKLRSSPMCFSVHLITWWPQSTAPEPGGWWPWPLSRHLFPGGSKGGWFPLWSETKREMLSFHIR